MVAGASATSTGSLRNSSFYGIQQSKRNVPACGPTTPTASEWAAIRRQRRRRSRRRRRHHPTPHPPPIRSRLATPRPRTAPAAARRVTIAPPGNAAVSMGIVGPARPIAPIAKSASGTAALTAGRPCHPTARAAARMAMFAAAPCSETAARSTATGRLPCYSRPASRPLTLHVLLQRFRRGLLWRGLPARLWDLHVAERIYTLGRGHF
jgi:hypothetical protein